MATKKVYDECVRRNRLIGNKSIPGDSYKPPMKMLFGEKLLVNKTEFECLGETEKERHLYEDRVLRLLYIEKKSYHELAIKKYGHIIAM